MFVVVFSAFGLVKEAEPMATPPAAHYRRGNTCLMLEQACKAKPIVDITPAKMPTARAPPGLRRREEAEPMATPPAKHAAEATHVLCCYKHATAPPGHRQSEDAEPIATPPAAHIVFDLLREAPHV
jgi:hypothetical protein